MNADPRIIGFLNRALSHEMSAVQQYLMQAKLASFWGMAELSAHFRRDVDEELCHAEKLMERMLAYGAGANATQLMPVRLGHRLEDILQIDRVLEIEAVRLYEEAVQYCERTRNQHDRELFASILADEIAHLKELDELEQTQVKRRA